MSRGNAAYDPLADFSNRGTVDIMDFGHFVKVFNTTN